MKRIREVTLALATLAALGLAAALLLPQARGEMIATPGDDARAQVKAALARPEVAREMQKMGIAPDQAAARVEAMSDAEAGQLAGRLDALPAGGRLSNEEVLLIVVIVLLIVILI
jgi:hypothetical protein